jgi:hypothetical protein
VPDRDPWNSGGEVLPLRRKIDDDELRLEPPRLEPPRLEPLTAAQEAEAAELLAALFATAAWRRVGVRRREEAA